METEWFFWEMARWIIERKANFNKSGHTGHCRIKEGNKTDSEVKNEGISAARELVREELKGPVSLRWTAVIEWVMQWLDEGESESYVGHRGREMAAIN